MGFGLRTWVVVMAFFNALILSAQSELFIDPSSFLTDLKSIIEPSRNYNAIQTLQKFEQKYWSNAILDDIDKDKITKIAAGIRNKNHPFIPTVTQLLNNIMMAMDCSEITHDILLHYFETLSKTVDYQELTVLQQFFINSNLFFEKRMFSTSFSSKVLVEGGSFDFEYAGYADSPATTPTEDAPQEPAQDAGLFDAWDDNPTSEADILSSGPVYTPDGPVIKIENATLQLISRYDTFFIHQAQGSYQLSDKVFLGKDGIVDWSSLGSDMAQITAEMPEYRLVCATNDMVVENVKFKYPGKLENEISGTLEYKIPSSPNPNYTSYPKFTSFSNDVELKSLARYLTYVGAFCLSGRKFSSYSVDEKPSTVVYNNGKYSFQATSKEFVFVDSSVTAKEAEIIIFIENDSISHPGVDFYYNPASQIVNFNRDLKGKFKNSPFRNTYHGFEFYVDEVAWNIPADSITLNILAAKRLIPAMFKSTFYFNEKEFNELTGVGNVHPLRVIDAYLRKTQVESVFLEEIVKAMKLNEKSFDGAMRDMDRRGFVNYTPVTGKIELLPKAYHFMAAHAGTSDFDNLYIPSLSPEAPNATIKLGGENVMLVRGVNRFFINDSSHVFAIPDSNMLRIYQDRDINFSGVLIAGIFYFRGQNFQFKYQDYEVIMPKIDSVRFMAANKKKKSKNAVNEKQFMDNQLVYSSGTLFINEPSNKSAKKNYPEYPMFDASTGAYVYFNGKEILGGAYNRRVYFKIPPFKTDSVKNIDRKNLRFKGTFRSGGILPDLEEELGVMPDNSLGFVHQTPKEGYPIYGGKAKFKGTVKLDNNGIRGQGELYFKSAVFYSNDIIFYQDSAVCQGPQAKVKEVKDSTAYFADADIADYELKLVPKYDSMHVVNLQYPFDLYKKQMQLEGSLWLTAKGLGGEGMLQIKGEHVIAPKIEFREKTVTARHAVLNTKLPGYNKNSIEVNNTKIVFNLKENTADMSPEIKGLAGIKFPLCEYATSIENAKWDLNKKMVFMEAENKNNIQNCHFIATNPEYDSLMFNGASAVYDIQKKTLTVEGVPFIVSADAKIIPDSARVRVLEEGKLRTFKNARMVVDTLNGYHSLTKGRFNILSKYRFEGQAMYRFANAKGDTFLIPMDNFILGEDVLSKKETARYTISEGHIEEKEKFHIAPKVLYKGHVKMYANRRQLEFNGFVKMDVRNKELITDWVPYQHDGATEGFVLALKPKTVPTAKKGSKVEIMSEAGPIDTTIEANTTLAELHTGILYESGGIFDLYSTLLSRKKNEEDLEMFAATGELRYDKKVSGFIVGDAPRLEGKTLAGNKYTYNDSLQFITCEGSYNLIHPDANFSLAAAGELLESLSKHNFSMNVLASLKLNIPPKALDLMAQRVHEALADQSIIHQDTLTQASVEFMASKIAQLAGDKPAKNFIRVYEEALDYKPLYRYASKLTEGIAIANVDLEWSNEHNAWYSRGKIKLSNILTTDINAKTDALMEIKRTEAGDNVTLLIRPNPDMWFFIHYQPGRVALLSTENDFNQYILSKSKGETGTPAVYTFVLADEAEHALFMKEFYRNYLGKNYDEYDDYKSLQKQSDSQEQNLDIKPYKNTKKSNNDAASDEEMPMKEPKKSKKAKKEDAPLPEPDATHEDDEGMPMREPKKKKRKVNIMDEE